MNIFLADDNDGFRQALHSFLAMQPDVVVIGEATNGLDAIAQVVAQPPDIAILDIVMPDLDGIEAARQICQKCPAVQVIIISSYATKPYIDDALQAGARGYILKESAGNELPPALQAVYTGQRFLSEQIVDCWTDD